MLTYFIFLGSESPQISEEEDIQEVTEKPSKGAKSKDCRAIDGKRSLSEVLPKILPQPLKTVKERKSRKNEEKKKKIWSHANLMKNENKLKAMVDLRPDRRSSNTVNTLMFKISERDFISFDNFQCEALDGTQFCYPKVKSLPLNVLGRTYKAGTSKCILLVNI